MGRQDGVSAQLAEQVEAGRQGPGQGGGSPTADGGLGSSWSLRHPNKVPRPLWPPAQYILPSGITEMLIITIGGTIVLRLFCELGHVPSTLPN